MRPRAITFDAFGTLVHHGLETIEATAAAIARDHGLPAPAFLEAWQRRYFGLLRQAPFRTIVEANDLSLRETAASFGVSTNVRPYLEQMMEWWREIRPYPETAKVLEELGEIPVAVVSNADHELLLQVLRDGGIPITCVISSERARSYKPDGRIFQEALRALSVPAETVLHLGDSLEADVLGASRAGLRTAWVNRHGLPLTATAPDHEMRDLTGLLSLL